MTPRPLVLVRTPRRELARFVACAATLLAIASRDFTPPVHAYAAERLRWNTAGLPDGKYRLELRAWRAGGVGPSEVAERPVIVRH